MPRNPKQGRRIRIERGTSTAGQDARPAQPRPPDEVPAGE